MKLDFFILKNGRGIKMNHFDHFVHFDFLFDPLKMNHFDHFVHFDFF